MPKHLSLYQLKDIDHLIKHRKGETKLGEKFQFVIPGENLEEQLRLSEAKYVLFGIPEDLGVMLNYGRRGAGNAWQAVLSSLVNVQNNDFQKGKQVLLLGHFNFSDLLDPIGVPDTEILREQALKVIDIIDKEVTRLIQLIVTSGKKPIIIGGGHNNAYGIIKGCALAMNKPINVINIDAHSDFRPTNSRHSGNGFSYAYQEGFLKRYYIFGLHENYTSGKLFRRLDEEQENVRYNTLEELEVRREKGIDFEINEALDFVKASRYGIEIDCDAIAGVPSSAMSPTGFSLNTVRRLLHLFSRNKNVQYLHISEAAPDPEDDREILMAGKLISYLITDFIKKA